MTKYVRKINDTFFDLASILTIFVCCFISLFWQWFSLSLIMLPLIFFFMLDYEKSLCATVFLIPFHNVLRFLNITIVVYFVYVLFFSIAFIKLLINKQLKFNKTISILLIVLLIYSFLPIGTYKMIRWRWLSTFFIIIGACFVLKHLSNKVEYSKIVYALFLGIALSSVLRVIFESNSFIARFDLNNNQQRFEALMINPNYLSESCVMLCSMLLVVLYKNKNIVFTSVCFLISLIIGFNTGSKSFAILSILFILIFIAYFFHLSKKKHKLAINIVLSLALVAGLIVSMVFFSSRIDFKKEITATTLFTSRDLIWDMALKKLIKSPLTLLFGLGIGSEIRWSNAQTCHSVYIEILQKFGIVGSLLFIGLSIYCLVKLFKKYQIKKNIINLLPLVILAMYSLTDTIIFPATSMMIFPICFMGLFYNLPKKETQQK